jgi:ABC-type polysaccharide/polyol phosphate transport system ATPase subunit
MSLPAIAAENLAKKYDLRHQANQSDGIRHKLEDALLRPFRRRHERKMESDPTREEFWALRDVSFSIEPGEVMGVIGRNGAGKSTLLKVLSRVTEPTRGRVTINGRVASLLEVGTGFHPELTGRENVYLNGTILGMSRREIRKKFDEIVAFAEVEKFLDTPVKHYSSGMYMRLAFAVAAHLEPEILIVDEVLAVGDAQFQRKCLGKMQDVSQREGRTILFVSHNMAAISSLTRRVVLLKKGSVEFIGAPQTGINLYMAEGESGGAVYTAQPSAEAPNFTRIAIACSESANLHDSGKPWSVTFQIHAPAPVEKACLSFQVFNQSQSPVLHVPAYDQDLPVARVAGTQEFRCEIPSLKLNVGNYYLKVFLSAPPGGRDYETLDQICPFEVTVLNRTTLFGWRPEVCTYLETAHWSAA